ncbi:MAG: acyltransferase domain-containing protein [Pirellulales bacterium]
MGRADFDALPAAHELFERAAAVLGYDLAALCFDGPAEKLDATEFSQPALFVAGLAALEVLKSKQPELVAGVRYTAGLSLGEYSALVFADVLSFEDGLRVVRERGRAMQAAADAVPSGMASILGLERDKLDELCKEAAQGELLQPANYLCPGNIAISGVKSAVERAVALAPEHGAMKAIPLSVAGAVSYVDHATGRRTPDRRAGRGEVEQTADRGGVERRRRDSRRSGRDPRVAGPPSVRAGPVGRFDAAADRPRHDDLLGSRPRPRPPRPDETDRSEVDL